MQYPHLDLYGWTLIKKKMGKYKQFWVVFPNEEIRDLFNGIVDENTLNTVDNPFKTNKEDGSKEN